jgi:hypothetical protein
MESLLTIWEAIKGAPSALWSLFSELGAMLKTAALLMAGKEWQKKIERAERAENLAGCYETVLKEERLAKSRPTSGSAARLRASGYTKR